MTNDKRVQTTQHQLCVVIITEITASCAASALPSGNRLSIDRDISIEIDFARPDRELGGSRADDLDIAFFPC